MLKSDKGMKIMRVHLPKGYFARISFIFASLMPKIILQKSCIGFLILCACLLGARFAGAQDNSGTTGSKASEASSITGYSKDYLMFEVSYDGLVGSLPDSVKTKGISRGFNMAFMYDFRLDKSNPRSNYSLGAGVGLSTSALFLNQTMGIADSTASVPFQGNSPYKKYKLATNFVEIPVELRYRQYPEDANKGFKAAIGLKFGALFNVHTKGKRLLNSYNEIDKTYSKRFFNQYRAAATARIGWGNISLFGSYTITGLFKQNEGPVVQPFSIGLCLSGM
jgi:hypothetical protein